jgi:hypothetical protein
MAVDFIPERLRTRLGEELADRLRDVVETVERVLSQVYEMDARAYDPSIGDNAQLFGLNIWHHGWFAIDDALAGMEGVLVSHEDGSHRIHIGPLTIAVYKGGRDESSSIYDVSLDGSATKRSYVERNQLQLFSLDEIAVQVPERAYELNTLWIVHFGNPREELVKLYLGAPTRNIEGRDEWAWHRRIDNGDSGALANPSLPAAPPPFDEQPEPEIPLELEDDVEETGTSDGD